MELAWHLSDAALANSGDASCSDRVAGQRNRPCSFQAVKTRLLGHLLRCVVRSSPRRPTVYGSPPTAEETGHGIRALVYARRHRPGAARTSQGERLGRSRSGGALWLL